MHSRIYASKTIYFITTHTREGSFQKRRYYLLVCKCTGIRVTFLQGVPFYSDTFPGNKKLKYG